MNKIHVKTLLDLGMSQYNLLTTNIIKASPTHKVARQLNIFHTLCGSLNFTFT